MTPQGKILIADDDGLFLRTTAAVLEQSGHTCVCVTTATAVTELVIRESFDLLIADVWMPGNTQLELLRILHQAAVSLPTILVTECPSLETALPSIQFQIVAYLVKPFAVAQLLTEVQRAVERAEMQKTMLELRGRWRAWGEELLSCAAALPPQAVTSRQALEIMLEVSLGNLSRCIADIQELRRAISGGAQPVVAAPAPVCATGDALETRAPQLVTQKARTKAPTVALESIRLPVELRAELQQLSQREREVLRLLLANHKPQIIAKKLFISLHTVRNHLRSIFEKLDVHSQTELLTRLGRHVPYADWQEIV